MLSCTCTLCMLVIAYHSRCLCEFITIEYWCWCIQSEMWFHPVLYARSLCCSVILYITAQNTAVSEHDKSNDILSWFDVHVFFPVRLNECHTRAAHRPRFDLGNWLYIYGLLYFTVYCKSPAVAQLVFERVCRMVYKPWLLFGKWFPSYRLGWLVYETHHLPSIYSLTYHGF